MASPSAVIVKQAILTMPNELASYIPSEVSLKDTTFHFKVEYATQLTDAERDAAWNIFSTNMKNSYKASSFGWNPPEKKRELYNRLGRFILVRASSDPASPVVAFAVFRFEREEDEKLVYCYELQVVEKFARHGLGTKLMQYLWDIGQKKGMEKVMLTVFKSNQAGVKFYEKNGYTLDPSSPGYCSPSDEWVDDDDEEDYQIMSKGVHIPSS